jgi:hypothetical protein
MIKIRGGGRFGNGIPKKLLWNVINTRKAP